MTKQALDFTAPADDLPTAADKINDNFDELYKPFLLATEHCDPLSSSDQTTEINALLAQASSEQRTILAPRGTYYYTGPLVWPVNCYWIGCGQEMFGTQLIALNSSGILVDGAASWIHHGGIQNTMLGHEGSTAGAYMLKINKAYSMVFRSVRFHRWVSGGATTAPAPTEAVISLVNTSAELSLDNLFERISMQWNGYTNAAAVGVLCGDECGVYRFIDLDVEAMLRNLKWEGGQIELYAPYFETAGVNAIDLTCNSGDTAAYFKCFGGKIGCAASAVGVAIRDNCHDVDFYGTRIFGSTDNDVYVYGTGVTRINLDVDLPDWAKFNGVAGYQGVVSTPRRRLTGSKTHDWGNIAASSSESTTVTVTGARLGFHTARAFMSISQGGLQLHAYISADDTATVIAHNPNVSGGSAINLGSGTLKVVADSAPLV